MVRGFCIPSLSPRPSPDFCPISEKVPGALAPSRCTQATNVLGRARGSCGSARGAQPAASHSGRRRGALSVRPWPPPSLPRPSGRKPPKHTPSVLSPGLTETSPQNSGSGRGDPSTPGQNLAFGLQRARDRVWKPLCWRILTSPV